MSRFFWICAAGAVGTGARYLISGWALAALGAGFPYGTLAVNVVGSFLMGIVMQVGLATPILSPTLRMTLATGFIGGFTTYSTFNYETIRLVQTGAWKLAIGNVTITLVTSFAAGLAGIALGRSLFGG